MTLLERLKMQTGETDEVLLNDILETAKVVILNRRFPYGDWPTREVVIVDEDTGEETTVEETFVEDKYIDLQYRIALDLYNKRGVEGQLSSGENGISRGYESSWVSAQLLLEIAPKYIGI